MVAGEAGYASIVRCGLVLYLALGGCTRAAPPSFSAPDASAENASVPDEPPSSWPPAPGPTGFTFIPKRLPLGIASGWVEAVVGEHIAEAKRRCWDAYDGGASDVSVIVHIVVDATGHVSSARYEGGNATVGACLKREVKDWVFPAPGVSTPLDLPLRFVRARDDAP
jgi:hypothetical protein